MTTGELLQSVLEALRLNAELVLMAGVGAGLLLVAWLAYDLGWRRSGRRAIHLNEQVRALEKSLAQAQADGSAALRQLAQYETQLASLTQELGALRTSQAQTLARLEQTQRDNEQLRQQHAEWAGQQQALAESKGRLQGQVHTLDGELQRLRSELDSKAAEIEALRQQCASLRTEHLRLRKVKRQVQRRLAGAWKHWQAAYEECLELRLANNQLNQQLAAIEHIDGKIWERPPADVPEFVPPSKRRARILAFSNLKGGVGKTTLAANLGAMLAGLKRRPGGHSEIDFRVLLVDLDYQGSLTSLCLPPEAIQEIRQQQAFVDQPLAQAASQGPTSVALSPYCRPRPGMPELRIVAADENLAEVETQVMARWLLRPAEGDVRFLLRRLLHAPEIAQQYDFVILDCPPRLTTACVNAYAAADYLLVPVILDTTSAEAVPRQLRTLHNHRTHLCPQVAVLGLVANRVYPRREVIQRERRIWESLAPSCRDVWGQEVYQFRTLIRQKPAFADAARENRFAIANSEVDAMFRDLALEVLERIDAHEGRRPASRTG